MSVPSDAERSAVRWTSRGLRALPIGTVRSRLNRLRAHLRELVEPGGESRVKPVDLARSSGGSRVESAAIDPGEAVLSVYVDDAH